MRAIADSPHLTSLKELDVSNNSLSAVALQPILDGPPANRLFRLILTENRLGDAGVAALVASPVFARMAERDRVIDLRRVEMGPAGARSLAASPALRHVESLDLEGNMLGDAGLAAIAASPHLTQIRVLNLHGNRIGDDGARALSRSALMEPIRVIDLTNNMITQESQDRLHEAKARFNWRGELQLKVNSKHNLRSTGLLAAFVRRPIG
jgi:Ran GTPase-activating protein (RanGAP) involved in mRNA processing and transport